MNPRLFCIVSIGLFAAQDIPKDTVLFTEFPFIYAPPMKRFNMILSGDACGLCARSIKFGNVLICACPACSRVKYCTKGMESLTILFKDMDLFVHRL